MITEEIYDIIRADATVVAQVGTRIYPVILPPEVTVPAITYRAISSRHDPITANMPTDRVSRFQIDVWAETLLACQTVSDAIVSLFTQYEGGTIIDSSIDLVFDTYDTDIKLYRRATDIRIYHSGS